MKSSLSVAALVVLAAFAVAAPAQVQTARQTQTFETSDGSVKITPIYHATMLIEAGGKAIYVDPIKAGNFTGLPPAGLILVTDIHPDHMDPATISVLSTPGTEILAPPTVVQTVTAAKPVSNGETRSWGGWTIEAIPMYNMTRGPAPGKFFSR